MSTSNEDAAHTVRAIQITFLVLDTIAIGLRTYSRVCISRSYGYDDAATTVAFAGFVLLCALSFKSLDEGYGLPTMTLKAAKYFVICQLTYIATMIVSKVAAACVIYRLASNEKMVRHILVVTTAMFLVGTTVMLFIVGFQCRPLAASWGEVPGKCISAKTMSSTAFAFSAFDISLSWLHAFLPAYMIWHVQISPRTKFMIIALLGLGVVSNIATIMRLKELIAMSQNTSVNALEQAGQYLRTFIYSVLEVGLTLFAASMVAIRPVLKSFLTFIDWSSNGSRRVTGASAGLVTIGGTGGVDGGAAHGARSKSSMGGGGVGASIRLDDMAHSDNSQEDILGQNKDGIQRKVKYEVSYA